MEPIRKLQGTKTYLSPLTPEHAPLWYRWHNHLDSALLSSCPGLRSSGTEASLRGTIETFVKNKWSLFLIVDASTDEPIGWCGLVRIEQVARRAMLAILIGETGYWGKGYGEEATRLLLDFGFNLLNLNSVELIVNEENARAIRCYEKVGFQVVGRRRQSSSP